MIEKEVQAQKQTDRPADPSLIDAAALALALGADLEQGLSSEEAARRLVADGRNELRAVLPVPAWRRALAQLQDPLVYLLGAAAAVALAAWCLKAAVKAAWPAGRWTPSSSRLWSC